MQPENQPGVVRIGELSRRVGVRDHVLRAWETRYRMLVPVRSPGGLRMHSDGDERRVAGCSSTRPGLIGGRGGTDRDRRGHERVAPGSLTLGSVGPARLDLHELERALQWALDDFDEGAAQAVLDRLLSDLTVTTTLRDVVVPYLQQLGERWERGEITIAQEHFASNVIRGRLAGLARGWGTGHGRSSPARPTNCTTFR